MNVQQILDLKGKDVLTIEKNTSVQEFAQMVADRGIGAAPVTNGDGSLVGVISERDVTRGVGAHGGELMSKNVADLMTTTVITCGPDNTVSDVVELMRRHNIRHMPVVNEDRLEGFISIRDVLYNRMGQLELDNETLRAMLENYDSIG